MLRQANLRYIFHGTQKEQNPKNNAVRQNFSHGFPWKRELHTGRNDMMVSKWWQFSLNHSVRFGMTFILQNCTNLLRSCVESTGHLQPVLPLVRRDCELFPHTVESGQRVPWGAGGTTQRLAQHHCGLQQLAAVIIGALKTEKGNTDNKTWAGYFKLLYIQRQKIGLLIRMKHLLKRHFFDKKNVPLVIHNFFLIHENIWGLN